MRYAIAIVAIATLAVLCFSTTTVHADPDPDGNDECQDHGCWPHCAVVSVYRTPPYYDVHQSCLFPL